MKKLLAILTAVVLTAAAFAQAPQKMSYHAVIRDAGGAVVANHAVGMQVSVLSGTTPVYMETHTDTTNANGLVSVEIGGGTPVSGSLAGIDWSNGQYTLKTETDPAGGTSYSITGQSQLLSVPYSMYAEKAGNGFSGDYNDLTNKPALDGSETKVASGTDISITGTGTAADPYVVNSTTSGFTHSIGQMSEGGIVVGVWKESGVEHGLVASMADVNASYVWSNVNTGTGLKSGSFYDGKSNTAAIIAQTGHSTSAAWLCECYVSGTYTDWYLPAMWELDLCYSAAAIVNTRLGSANGFQPDAYWSSTEENGYTSTVAFSLNFMYNTVSKINKSQKCRVRAVRTF